MPRLVGPARAAELLLFPRSVKADEALQLGLAQRVVPADELPGAAEELARQLAQGPTASYAAIKESLAYGSEHSLAQTLEKEAALQIQAGASDDHRIAVEAFVAKEQPRFTGR